MRYASIYARLVGVSLQSQLQYRGSLAMQAIGQFFITGIDFVAIAFLFARFGSFSGWSMGEVALLYGLADISFAAADALARGFDLVGQMVKSGDFDRLLLRPVPVFLQLLGHELTVRRIGRFLQGAAIFAWACATVGVPRDGVGALALFGGFSGSVFTFVAIFAMQGALAFKAVESLEIVNAVSYGGRFVASYPLGAFKPYLRGFFLFAVPIGCMIYLPACAALGRDPFPGVPSWIGLMSPMMCAPFVALAAAVWSAGLRRYQSTGS
jgi:ABC-2 type transport system permease protein